MGRFSPRLRQANLEFVLARQTSEGGFPGRRGGADLYYCDFAARLLVLLDSPEEPLLRLKDWLESSSPAATTVVDCFSLLNLRRLLARRGHCLRLDESRLLEVLGRHRLERGGYAGTSGGWLSAYSTFIAALCAQMLDSPVPAARESAAALGALEVVPGGHAETAGETSPQTCATAAVVSFLEATGQGDEDSRRVAARFLSGMQTPDGGFAATPEVPWGDLLSTFSGLLALGLLGDPSGLDLPALARFAGDCAGENGGFGAQPGDDPGDVEYTYYGLGSLALLAGIAAGG